MKVNIQIDLKGTLVYAREGEQGYEVVIAPSLNNNRWSKHEASAVAKSIEDLLSPSNQDPSDKEFLQWIHDRLEFVYNENHDISFMWRLRELIEKQKD